MKYNQDSFAKDERMYEAAQVWRPAARDWLSPPQTSPGPAPASTPPTPSSTLDAANFEDIWADGAAEHTDDWLDIAHDPHVIQETSSILDARAMAEDFSEGRLETFVGTPQKELAGTQNAYVSYLVSTKVHSSHALAVAASYEHGHAHTPVVRLPVVPKARLLSPPPLHRLRLPLETAHERVSAMRRPTAARQAQDGVCSWRPLRSGLHPTARTLSAPLPEAVIAAPSVAQSYASHHLPRNSRLESAHEGEIFTYCKWVGA